MSDRITTDTETRPAPNPHDVALAVLRPQIYGEAHDLLREMNPGLLSRDTGFRIALVQLAALQKETTKVPSAGMLDHASAAYARFFADRLDATGYAGAAQLLRHVADDFDGGAQ